MGREAKKYPVKLMRKVEHIGRSDPLVNFEEILQVVGSPTKLIFVKIIARVFSDI